MSCKPIAARAEMRLLPSMDLGMPFEVVLADETFLAVIATPLPVPKVSLYMRPDVFFSTKQFLATFVHAYVFVFLEWSHDVRGYLVFCYPCFFIGPVNVHRGLGLRSSM